MTGYTHAVLDIETSFRKSMTIKASPEEVYAFLVEYERSIKMVPGIDKVVKKGDGHYRWIFKPVGAKGLSLRPEYETKFSEVENAEVRWENVPGKGNADVRGRFRLKETKGGTRLELNVDITAHLPLPRIMSLVAGPAADIQTRITMEKFLQNIKEYFDKA